ncbi:porin [Paraburkholderia aspalathi]|jgi:predicted porin|uniref:porin n=1 Tax=Paraburkholderia aspalathi TaxID=1324617 RepID=UPI0038BC114B
MKKAYLGCLLGGFVCAAHAQSTITLYGIVDLGVTYVNNAQTGKAGGALSGAHQFALTDGTATGVSGSRWGLRGTEDLGGGLKSLFVIENGFNANNGVLAQGGTEFGRQAYVGITGGPGTVTLGRQYDTLVDFLQPLAVVGQWAGFMGTHPDDVDNLANSNRINNAVKFTSAAYHGFSAGAAYSFGGTAGSITQNQIWSIGAGYTGGSLSLGAGYLNARDPNISFYGNTPNKGGVTADNMGALGSATSAQSNPVYAGYASAKTTEIVGVGAAYTISATTLGFVATNTRFESLGSASGPNPFGYSGTAQFTNLEVSVRSRLTPALLIGTAFDYMRRNSVKGDGGARYLQLDFGADYNLSKRTDLYALTVLQRASGRDSLNQAAVASISGFSPSTTSKQVGVRVALRHKF